MSEAELRKRLAYDPETGHFEWLVSRYPSRVGSRAGSVNAVGYWRIEVGKKHYSAHRLAWFMVHNEWPDQIDHINGHRSDNRLCNLRNVSCQENQRNRGLAVNNSSGVIGVSRDRARGRWRAIVTDSGSQSMVCASYCWGKVVMARKQTERAVGFHPNHGRA